MSSICNSIDGDNIIPQQEEVLPFFQNYLSPFLDENQLFSVPLGADECQQADVERISNMPLPTFDINMNTGQEISNSTPFAGTVIHQHNLMPNNNSSGLTKSTLNKGSMARRSGKKDRHTKITTAKGVRDRRMRLSLQIARKFFDLQDRLGFDKASKTIEWLFSKSKKAINKLSSNASQVTQMSSNNSCAKGSKSLEISEGQMKVKIASDQGECEVSGTKKTQKSATRSTEHNAKDLRDNARARARKRTREKYMNRCLEESNWSLSDQGYNCSQLGPAENPNPLFEIRQESMSNTSSQDNISTSQSSIHHHLPNMELLGPTTSPSESVWCSMYGYDLEKNDDLFSGELDSYSNNPFYLGWDIISAEFLNPNSLDFLECSDKNFDYSDHSPVV